MENRSSRRRSSEELTCRWLPRRRSPGELRCGYAAVVHGLPVVLLIECENEEGLLGPRLVQFHPRPNVPAEVPVFIARQIELDALGRIPGRSSEAGYPPVGGLSQSHRSNPLCRSSVWGMTNNACRAPINGNHTIGASWD